MLSSLGKGAYLKAGDPRSTWNGGTGSGQVDLLLDTIKEVSIIETGRWDSIQGAVISSDPTLLWALRDFQEIRFYEVYDPEILNPVVITHRQDFYLVPQSIYRGQDFVISTKTAWEGISPDDWISWIAFGDGPIESEGIILWVRNDILSGTNNHPGQN